VATDRYDVAIMGGGLAGLTLALQLKRTRPATSVVVLERRKGPAPLAAFKVGESTLEIGAYYFTDVCGLRDHLDEQHLWKPGLRYFFTARDNRDVTRRVEWGPPGGRAFNLKTFQIDRGLFENEIAERCRAHGVEVRDGAAVKDIVLGSDGADHRITYAAGDAEEAVSARWLVDAAGRAFLLKRKLGLERPVDHAINSAWLRLKGGLTLDDWSDDPTWQARMWQPHLRWLYTNHLMGRGYWVWLIPLSSDAISIGVVADPRIHPFERISTLDATLEWLDEHEPVVADAVRSRPDDVQDFLRIENYPFGVERVYSTDRWCLTGDAGAFSDPFYSPGSDYIGLANGCITELVTRDLDGERVDERVEALNAIFLREFHRLLHNYTRQYDLFGNAQVMSVKICWDVFFYWSISCLRYIHGVWHDPDFDEEVRGTLDRAHELNQRMQVFFREWHELDDRELEDAFMPLVSFTALAQAKFALETPLEPDAVKSLLAANLEKLEAFAVVIFHRAAERLPDGAPAADRPVNAYAVGLSPERWERDRLFQDGGMTLEQARGKIPGVDTIWVDDLVGVIQVVPQPAGPPGGPPGAGAGQAGPPPGPPPGGPSPAGR